MPHLGKVCLVACDVALPDPGQPFLADAFCDKLAKLCAKASPALAPPLVAGWDTFVTVAFPANTSINKTLRNTTPVGSKVAQVASGVGGKALAKSAPDHKWVWVWSGSKYERKRLSESGWSSKLSAQSTPDGKVALLNTSQN